MLQNDEDFTPVNLLATSDAQSMIRTEEYISQFNDDRLGFATRKSYVGVHTDKFIGFVLGDTWGHHFFSGGGCELDSVFMLE